MRQAKKNNDEDLKNDLSTGLQISQLKVIDLL